jgi:hypothetical protein
LRSFATASNGRRDGHDASDQGACGALIRA